MSKIFLKPCGVGCNCTPRIIATKSLRGSYDDDWNFTGEKWFLTAYQGDNVGTPNAMWRLFERSYCNSYPSGETSNGVKNGFVNANGKLLDLPDWFETGMDYCGYMELQIGCCTCKNHNDYYCDPSDSIYYGDENCEPNYEIQYNC